MRSHALAIPLFLVISTLFGCAMPSAIKPGTTADELLQRLGKPTEIRPAAQGGESWDYVYGPEGFETWRFEVDPDRMVRNTTQLLTQERLYRVVPGATTESQVLQLLGKPREITRFREEVAWEWRVSLAPDLGIFVVRFGHDGRVTGFNVLVDASSDSNDRESSP